MLTVHGSKGHSFQKDSCGIEFIRASVKNLFKQWNIVNKSRHARGVLLEDIIIRYVIDI